MKQHQGKDMVIYGSGSLVSVLAHHGLIDEYRLIANPVNPWQRKTIIQRLDEQTEVESPERQDVRIGKCPA